MFLNKIIWSRIKFIVFCTICIALCGSNVTEAPSTETLTAATTGLEDIFSDVEKQSLSIKNISFETNDNDEYYLNWFFDNGNNVEMESTIDVYIKNEGPVVFFRHIERIDKSQFFKINIGKLEKCSSYNVTLQAYNKLGDTEKYQYNFETSPLNIEDIVENITNNKTSITWTSPCSNFQVTMQRRPGFVEVFYLTNNTHRLDVNLALYCTNYSITALSANGTQIGAEINRKIVPGPVENLKLTSSATSIQVTWSPPEDDHCITGYNIWRNVDKVEEDLLAESNSHDYSGLNSCHMYRIGVASVSEKEIGPYKMDISKTLAPTDGLSQVVDLKITEPETEQSITVGWSVLPQEERCIHHFSVTINNDPAFNQTQTVYIITKPIACQTYTVSVVAVGVDTIQSSEPNTKEYTANEKAQNPPKIGVNMESGLEMNSIKFDVVTDPITVNACKLTSVEITCEAKSNNSENDPNLPWVNVPVAKNFRISTEETEFQLELTELFAYTNYTCYGISKTDTLSSLISAEVEARTKLFETQNLVITNITSNRFNIAWIASVPHVNFSIEVAGLGPIHYIPKGCILNVEDIAEETAETVYEAKGLLPSYNYKVSVKIISWLGTSEPTEITGVTLTEASEKVRNLDKKIEVVSVEDYKVTADVFWTYPCNTNGKVSEFKIIIVETNKETSIVNNPSDHIVKIDDPEPELNYNYKMKLNPYCEYTITINAINEHAGLEETITFDSPEGFAEAPEAEVTDITSSGFDLKWTHPTANGVLIKYQVEINDLGPKFDIPRECEPQSTPQVIKEMDKEITKFKYSDALAYHEYEIKLSAITQVGLGKASASIKNTFGSEPKPIRDMLVKRFESHSSDEFQADMHTEFKPSCNLAGVFFEYEIHIIGEREGFEKHYENYTIKDINGIDTTMTPLRPEYNYIVTGRVKNDVAASTDVSYQFKAPSGVPGLSDAANITAPNSASSIMFLRSSFTNINGEVLYFAVLLSANYDFDDDYAYWESWPALGQYSRGPGLIIEPYQITVVNWKPEKTEEVISYELANQNCEDQAVLCNGALREETKYTVTVRGFTEDGYRDMRTHFNMPSLARSISLGVILGITFGIIFTGFIFIGSYLVYRRGMFRTTKPYENGRHSATNAHSPKDACIVLPSKAYKKDQDENAGSFATLQKTSERNKGVTSVAEAEDNRKKNRYINILPFDSTRVVLNDGIESDYINASFITGYSHQIEYIAAQGPLEGTVEHFWRMVAQEKVTTILMLTQLKEQNREKCFKYFPFNLENMRLNDMNLYCSEEDVCKSYIHRKIVLDIGTDTFNIEHFQYTDWPDFNVPDGTETMIRFVKKIRKIKNQIGGVILVHCSAGVGRTGTLISIDILLQTIDDGHKYNIYQTVLDLRSQRVNMVQNEKQYLYIGSCVEDYVKSRRKSGVYSGTEEPIYANVISRKY